MELILDNLRLTRKHRVTHVENDRGKLIWTGKSTGEAIAWMVGEGKAQARLRVGNEEFEIEFKRWPI